MLNEAANEKKKISAQQTYEMGLACVEKKVKAALSLYNEMQIQFDSYGNRCLYDTFVKGMPEFFKWYDIRFAPQDTILTLDCPAIKFITKFTCRYKQASEYVIRCMRIRCWRYWGKDEQ